MMKLFTVGSLLPAFLVITVVNAFSTSPLILKSHSRLNIPQLPHHVSLTKTAEYQHHHLTIGGSSSTALQWGWGPNSDNGKLIREPNSTHKKNLAMTTAAIIGVSAFSFPASSLALNTDSLVVGASSLLSSTTIFMDSFTATGFYQAFSLVFLSEIGDKTFFIAGLLAMKTSRFVSYVGSMGALAIMTLLSVLIGQIFHAVPAGIAQGIPLDDVAAVAAFTFFGFKTLKEAFDLDPSQGSVMDEELAEAEETVEGSDTVKQVTRLAQILSTFGLVFAAEFGDRSFLSTIALSAAQNPVSVAGGAIAAHGLATGIAVSGGSYLAKYISEKAIGFISGALFLIFAATTAIGIF